MSSTQTALPIETDVQCIDCKHFDLPGSHLRHLGFGLCRILSMTRGHTFSANWPHPCEHFVQATEAVRAANRKVL